MAQNSVRRGDDKAAHAHELPSIIASALRITGNVVSGGVVHVEGEVDGDVQCAELTIGAGGRVSGSVTAGLVYVLGHAVGTIRARTVHLGPGAVVRGEIIHETLVMEHGARVDGYSRPMARIDMPESVELRRYFGKASPGDSSLPRNQLPASHGRPRQAVATPPSPAPISKPLH
jgi:cytoskeletal protein CcmA (bactofilin family)